MKRYDKSLKRERKVTREYIGVVTKNGIVKKSPITGIREVYEYRNIQSLPMKSVHYMYEKTYLARIMDESMSPDPLSRMLFHLPED